MKPAILRLLALPLALAASFAAGLPVQAAGFVNTKDGWMALSPNPRPLTSRG